MLKQETQDLLEIRQWLDKVLLDDAGKINGNTNLSAVGSNSTSSTSLQILPVENEHKTLGCLTVLMDFNEEAELKNQLRNSILKRFLDASKRRDDLLDQSILFRFQSSFRHLRSDPAFEDNLRLLLKIFNGAFATVGYDDGYFTNWEESALFLVSALFRYEARNEQRHRILSADCQFLEEKLSRLTLEKRTLDELFENKRRAQQSGNISREISNLRSDTLFLRKKSERYAKRVNELKHQLYDIRGFKPELSRDAFIRNEKRNDDLQKELQRLRKGLQVYRDLPPNIGLARLRLEQAKTDLNKLNKLVQEKFSG